MQKILVRFIIEIIGAPEDHVKKVLNGVLANLEKEKDITIIKKDIKDTKKIEEFWSTFSEVEIETYLERLPFICFDYTPSSIEILEPSSMKLDCRDISDFLNDMLANLHQVNMHLKNILAENISLKRKLGMPITPTKNQPK